MDRDLYLDLDLDLQDNCRRSAGEPKKNNTAVGCSTVLTNLIIIITIPQQTNALEFVAFF